MKQGARKTFYETSNFDGQNINEGKVESKDKSASFVTPFRMDEKKYSSLPSSASSNCSMAIKISFQKARKQKTQTGELKAIEIKEAKTLWIKFIQKTYFPKAFNSTNGTVSKKDYKNQLGIQLHEDGLLHCHGRMIHAELPHDAVYPILLPKRSHFTSLLIKEYHQKVFHSGVSHTLAQLGNEYWILREELK